MLFKTNQMINHFSLVQQWLSAFQTLTHWGRVTDICVGNLTIFGSDNGLSPGRCQAIFWTNAGLLIIGPLGLGTNFSEILIEIRAFSFKKMHLNMSSGKWRPFCLDLNELSHCRNYLYPRKLTELKDSKTFCRPDGQITYELYRHHLVLTDPATQNTFTKCCLIQWISTQQRDRCLGESIGCSWAADFLTG